MGFFDSIGGFFDSIGTGIGNVLGANIPGSQTTVAGALAGIGVELLRSKVVGTPVQSIVTRQVQAPRQLQFPGSFGSFAAPQRSTFNPISNAVFQPGGVTPVAFGGFDMATVLPGGAQIGTQGGIGDFFGGNPGFNCPVMFRPTLLANGTASASPMSMVMIENPMTGAPTLFKSAGRILLTSSDITAHRRVNALARKAARRRPR